MKYPKRHNYLEGWKIYPKEAFGHHVQGAIAGVLLFMGVPFLAASVLWTIMYIAYQGFSLIRKGDSAGLDVADFLVGFWAGLLGGTIYAGIIF